MGVCHSEARYSRDINLWVSFFMFVRSTIAVLCLHQKNLSVDSPR